MATTFLRPETISKQWKRKTISIRNPVPSIESMLSNLELPQETQVVLHQMVEYVKWAKTVEQVEAKSFKSLEKTKKRKHDDSRKTTEEESTKKKKKDGSKKKKGSKWN